MTFTFIVETGNADPDANSFVSLEYADDYIGTNSYVSAAWTALSDDAKEKLLVRSSKYIDNYVAWNGKRVDEDSGLRWPRSGVIDPDGFEIADDVIPATLQDATCEFASQLMSSDWTIQQGTYGMREVSVDVIDIKFDTEKMRASLPNFVIQMLTELGSVARGKRPAFKKIIRQ